MKYTLTKKLLAAFFSFMIIIGALATPSVALATLPAVTTEGPSGFIPNEPGSCYTYLSDYIKPAKKNNRSQVIRLQQFLNQVSGTNILTGTLAPAGLEVTGTYDAATQKAVKNFQHYYWPIILLPWASHGLKDVQTGTGVVYKTTQRWINMLNCPGAELDMPHLK